MTGSVRRGVAVALVTAAFLWVSAGTAAAWYADFFNADSSGNATYEAMVIDPQAVYDETTDTTYIVFQGPKLDPYVTGYDHATDSWLGTYRIADNPLSEDTHGGPALVIDDAGYLTVFYGGHNTALRYARSLYPHSIGAWSAYSTVLPEGDPMSIRATYPQPRAVAGGGIELFYRNDGVYTGVSRKGDWEVVRSSSGTTWTAAECVLDATDDESSWYACASQGPSGDLHVAAVLRDLQVSATDQFARRDVFYLKRDVNGDWLNAGGASVGPTRTADVMAAALAVDTGDEYTNQVVVREAPDGSPALLYLQGTSVAEGVCSWRFQRWDGTGWVASVVTTTDNLFDAADLTFSDDGAAHAYVVTGGVPDDQAVPGEESLAARGGDIEHWVLDSGATTWRLQETVRRSPGAATRYNNPQVVADDPDRGVLFCEWNNDASSFIHKVFLYVQGTYIQRQFNPDVTRLAGDNRVLTAIKISKEAFPMSSSAVVLASARSFADALCGVPLAQAYRAPVLLCEPGYVSTELRAELRRLDPDKVFILGGEVSLAPEVAAGVASALPGASIERLAGNDRYETSVKIARALEQRRPNPEEVVLASGADFADALSSSAFAARHGWPVLLSRPSEIPAVTEELIIDLAPSRIVLVGGPVALSPAVEARCARLAPATRRLWGANRYETAESIATASIADGHTLERPVVASGVVFADAIPGGLLAARYNSVVVLTRPDLLPEASARVLSKATRVVETYVLGGSVAISPAVENAIASILHSVEAR